MRRAWRRVTVPFWRWYWWSMVVGFVTGLAVNAVFNLPPGSLIRLAASITVTGASFALVYVVMRGHAAWFEWECQRAYLRILTDHYGKREAAESEASE